MTPAEIVLKELENLRAEWARRGYQLEVWLQAANREGVFWFRCPDEARNALDNLPTK